MGIEKSIQDLIQKNLPAQAAGEMKKFIEDAEEMKVDLEDTKDSLKIVKDSLERERKINQEMSDKLIKQQELDEREEECDKRELNCSTREREMNLEMANLKVSLLENNHDRTLQLVEKVFGNPSVKVETHGGRSVPAAVDQYGGTNTNTTYLAEDKTVTTTTSKE